MGNKIVTALLTVLLIITLGFGVVGYLNKDKVNTKPQTPTDNTQTENTTNANVIEYTDSLKHVDNMDAVLASYEFIKANKENENNLVKATINGSSIFIEIPRDAFNGGSEGLEEKYSYEITDVPTPQAVKIHINESNDVIVYSLGSDNYIYKSIFNAYPTTLTSIETYKYNISNVESYTSSIGSLNATTSQVFVIIKTSNGEYYTDYKYDSLDGNTLTKLTSEAVIENVESGYINKIDSIKNVAIEYVKNNNLLNTDSEIDVYIYKMIEDGLLKADLQATDNLCLAAIHNTSFGCIVDNNKSINDDYIKVSKVGSEYSAEYMSK